MKKLLIVLFLLFAQIASADDLILYGGASTFNANNDRGTAFSIMYNHPISNWFSTSISYINEGHVVDHKRDGLSVQGWGSLPIVDKLSIKLGLGPYLYCDTRNDGIDRGLGLNISGALTYDISQKWFADIMISRIVAKDNSDSDLVLFGIGYRLQ